LGVVDYLGLRHDADCYKEFRIGSQTLKRYSPKAIEKIREALEKESIDEIWRKRSAKTKGAKA
jgi:hypothetical protein